MFKGIIFDLDGTILYTIEDIHDSLNMALAEYSLEPMTLEKTRQGVGSGFRKLIDAAVPADLDEETRKAVGDTYLGIYSENCANKTKPYDGIPELLKQFQKDGIRLAINSNKSTPNSAKLMKINFPDITFTAVVGARADLPRKPDPAGVYEILKLMDLKPEEVLYVGDSDTDILTAKNAGLKSAGCLWGYRDEKVLKEAGADYLISAPEELAGVVYDQ